MPLLLGAAAVLFAGAILLNEADELGKGAAVNPIMIGAAGLAAFYAAKRFRLIK